MFLQRIETCTKTLLMLKLATYMFTTFNCVFMTDVKGCYKHLIVCLQQLIWSFGWGIIGCYKRLIACLQHRIECSWSDVIVFMTDVSGVINI